VCTREKEFFWAHRDAGLYMKHDYPKSSKPFLESNTYDLWVPAVAQGVELIGLQ
jgi:hypothetical protein